MRRGSCLKVFLHTLAPSAHSTECRVAAATFLAGNPLRGTAAVAPNYSTSAPSRPQSLAGFLRGRSLPLAMVALPALLVVLLECGVYSVRVEVFFWSYCFKISVSPSKSISHSIKWLKSVLNWFPTEHKAALFHISFRPVRGRRRQTIAMRTRDREDQGGKLPLDGVHQMPKRFELR